MDLTANLLISSEVAARGAVGLSEGGRGPRVEPGIPGKAVPQSSLAKRTHSGPQLYLNPSKLGEI